MEFSAKADDFPLVARKHAAQIYVDPKDFTGVVRATSDLQSDIQRVSGRKSRIVGELGQLAERTILVGTLGKSELIDRLVREHKIDVSAIGGKWESFLIQVVAKPLPGVESPWSSPAATSAARSMASTISPNRSAYHPGIGGPMSPSTIKTPCT